MDLNFKKFEKLEHNNITLLKMEIENKGVICISNTGAVLTNNGEIKIVWPHPIWKDRDIKEVSEEECKEKILELLKEKTEAATEEELTTFVKETTKKSKKTKKTLQ